MIATGLDAQQQKAVTHPASRLLVTAPAGSGKTRVLTARIGWLLEQASAQPRDFLVITFARKAAAELRHRLETQGMKDVPVMTFHAWAYRFLRSVHTLPFSVITDGQRVLLLRKIFIALFQGQRGADIRRIARELNWSVPFMLRELVHIMDTLRQFGLTLYTIQQYASQNTSWVCSQLLIELWQQYERILERHGVSDFPLLLVRAEEVLKSRKHFVRLPKYILIDEAQDASKTELSLLTCLMRRETCATWVGDSNQAVYAWRGAVPLQKQDAHISLVMNYRSDSRIIRAVNYFLSRSSSQAMQTVLPARYTPQIIIHQRYAESTVVAQIVEELFQIGYKARDIMILARTHAPLKSLSNIREKYMGLRMATVHAAKGLEALVVIILNCSEDRFGFPLPERPASHKILIDLAHYDQKSEERRLFYVALTRARERLIVLSNAAAPSAYLAELPSRYWRRNHSILVS